MVNVILPAIFPHSELAKSAQSTKPLLAKALRILSSFEIFLKNALVGQVTWPTAFMKSSQEEQSFLDPWPRSEESYKIGSIRPSFLPSVRKFSQNWHISFF